MMGERMPKENTTRYILLGLLNHEELSGYDLKKRIDLTVSRFWSVGYAQIYPTLAQMEHEGLVTKLVGESDKGPNRKIYSITQDGKECLRSWLLAPEEKEYTKYEILLKLFFGASIPAQVSAARIQEFEERQRQNLNIIRLFKQELGDILEHSDDHLYFYLTVLFGEQIYSAYLNWARQALELIEEKGRT